jgi:mxaK protein
MGLNARRIRILLGISILLLLGAAFEGWRLKQIAHWNELIVSRETASAGDKAPAEVRFASAYALSENGDIEGALSLYRQIEDEPQLDLRLAAKYNSANLYLKQALALRGASEASPALPLVELAKEQYRDLLRLDNADWDARYNLERALRLAPESEEDIEALAPPPGAERAITTMRGFTLGLP